MTYLEYLAVNENVAKMKEDNKKEMTLEQENKELKIQNIMLEKHNEALFSFIKKQIEAFEGVPLSDDGTHRLIVDHEVLKEAKQALIDAGYEFQY